MQDRLSLLEEKIAFLEQALSELSEEHFAQQKELIQLNLQFQKLLDKYNNQLFNDQNLSELTGLNNDKPPHY